MKQDKIRIGVIGVGHLGEYHVQKYKALQTVELVGVVDTNPDRAKEIAQRYDTKIFEERKDILDVVDGVSLAVPTGSHFDVAKDILSKGVHLLIEKPITYTIAPADTLIHMARERGLVLQVGLVERFNPAVVKMKSMLKNPMFIESHRMNQFTTKNTDMDVVLDLMIHDLDIILHMAQSDIKDVHAIGMSVITGKTDIANVRLIFENGIVANLTASRVSDKTLRKIRAFQPDAYLSANCLKRTFSITRLDHEVKNSHNFPKVATEKISFPDSDPLADEITSFLNAVNNGAKPAVTGEDGRRALDASLGIIDQIRKNSHSFQTL